MTGSWFTPLGVLAVLALVAFMFFQRGRDGVDLSPRGLLGLYVYVASLVGMLVLAAGLASATNAALSYAIGPDLIYGGNYGPTKLGPCPAGAGCPQGSTREELEAFNAQQVDREHENRERQRANDLIRGVTFTVFGGLFWAAHWAARRRVLGPEEWSSTPARGYLIVATATFGLLTVVAVPTGVQQVLSATLLPSSEFGTYRHGADSLGMGIVALVLWLIYLRLAVRQIQRSQ